MKLTGQIQYFRSDVDDELHPCAVCATDITDKPKPLILEVSPGALRDLPAAVKMTEEIATIAANNGKSCVVLRPTGRGSGSVYQNYGEVDVLEAIEHVAKNYPIDRRRITITGSSMGGAATWYLASHYPDLFAAVAPFCGYCDYRFWEKPGGLTFHMQPWEEFSWKSRSAAFLVENFIHTPVWIVHGEWDRAVGGGVPVAHSRQMYKLLSNLEYAVRYSEIPKTGHGCRTPKVWEGVILWMLEQQKPTFPNRVSLVTYDLRHNRSYWVTIDQLSRYGEGGEVKSHFVSDERLLVETKNVRTLSIGPVPGHRSVTVILDGSAIENINLITKATFRNTPDFGWTYRNIDLSAEKRYGVSGPIGDLFYEGIVLVPGTSGTDEETFFTKWVASNAVGYYNSRNGGVHRGGIPGDNEVRLRVISDSETSDELIYRRNLLLYGTYRTNSVLARFEGKLPLSFDGTTIHLCDKDYTADKAAIFAVFPHPDNPTRYVAVHGGISPDAICWGSHLDMQLLPDYLVYAGGKMIDWGMWGNDWKSQVK